MAFANKEYAKEYQREWRRKTRNSKTPKSRVYEGEQEMEKIQIDDKQKDQFTAGLKDLLGEELTKDDSVLQLVDKYGKYVGLGLEFIKGFASNMQSREKEPDYDLVIPTQPEGYGTIKALKYKDRLQSVNFLMFGVWAQGTPITDEEIRNVFDRNWSKKYPEMTANKVNSMSEKEFSKLLKFLLKHELSF